VPHLTIIILQQSRCRGAGAGTGAEVQRCRGADMEVRGVEVCRGAQVPSRCRVQRYRGAEVVLCF